MPTARTILIRIAGRRSASWSIEGTRMPTASSWTRWLGPAATSWSPVGRLPRSSRFFLPFLAGLLLRAVGVVEKLEREILQPLCHRESVERPVLLDVLLDWHHCLGHRAVAAGAADVGKQLSHEL